MASTLLTTAMLLPGGAAHQPARDLRDLDLRGADLREANLRGADLSGTDLSGANLADADLSRADLRGARLEGALLRETVLRGARWDQRTVWPAGFSPGVPAVGAGKASPVRSWPFSGIFWLIALLALLLDQATKQMVLALLPVGADPVPLVPGWLYLAHLRNPGALFGFLGQTEAAVPWIAGSALVATVVVQDAGLRSGVADVRGVAGLALLAGGGLGNLVDRLWLGSVVDFIGFCPGPVFNLADVCILAGAGLLIGRQIVGTGRR